MTDTTKNNVPDGFILLQTQNGAPKYAACMTGRLAGWLMKKYPDGNWVSERKLTNLEVMQAEDQRDDGIVHETRAATIQAAPDTGSRVDKLLDAAFGVLQHDTGEQNEEYVFLRKALKERFTSVLRSAATIQEPVMVAEPDESNLAGYFVYVLGAWCVTSSDDPRAVKLYRAAPMVADPAGVAADQAASVVLTDAQIDAIAEEQEEKYGQLCDADDMRIFARSVISEALKQSSGNSGELAQGEDSARLDAEPGPWVVLVEDADIDYTRLLDVVLSNGVYLMGCKWGELDWTQVRDWRYSGARASAETGGVKP